MGDKKLQKAIENFECGNYNAALKQLNTIIKDDLHNEKAHYYLCLIYHHLKKWSRCKKCAFSFLKTFGKRGDILTLLGDVYLFEGNYRKAMKSYRSAVKYCSSSKEKEELQEKIQKVQVLFDEKKSQPRLAVIVNEGGDKFTDELIEHLSETYWVRKFIIRSFKTSLLNTFLKAKTKGFLSDRFFQFATRVLGSELKKIMSWADVTWCEWANALAAVCSYIKPRGKKLFIRLHRYEAFTDIPFVINWKNVDGLVFVSKFMEEILEMRGLKLDGVNWKVIYNGIDVGKFQFKPRQKGYNIAWVAHIIPRKNLFMALEIIRKLVNVDSNYKLHVAGDFPDPEYEIFIKNAIKNMQLEENVILYGWVDDVNAFLEDKNYILSTSLHEGHPYNLIEAMARGIKPVIYNFYNASELFEEKFLFNTTDEAVQKILDDEYDSEYYRHYIEQKGWTLEHQAREFDGFIKELLDS
jgi:glycosyltransferase involved in cell wall biosynthesis